MPSAVSLPPAPPWYRDRWPWLLMAGPIVVVIAGVCTVWLAWSTDDGVVADDYYKRGLVINRELERTGRGEGLHLGAVLAVAPDGALRLQLSGPAPTPIVPAVRARFVNATRAGLDRTVSLAPLPDGTYAGRMAPLPPGRWRVAVETDTWRLPAVEAGGTVREVRLGAARAVD